MEWMVPILAAIIHPVLGRDGIGLKIDRQLQATTDKERQWQENFAGKMGLTGFRKTLRLIVSNRRGKKHIFYMHLALNLPYWHVLS
jgi:hypothetical protein